MKTLTRNLVALAAAAAFASPLAAFATKDVVITTTGKIITLDPYDANQTMTQAACKSFYEGLFEFDKDNKLQPVLCESYTVSPNGLEYTLKLRRGVKFHDGYDFKSDSVKATLERVANPENKLRRYTLYGNIDHVECVDDYTAKIVLKKPFSAFVNQLAHPSGAMISAQALKKYGNREIQFHPVGTGPFQFVEWNPTSHMLVKKFPGYWQKGLPKVDSLKWVPVGENNTRANMLRTGEAHFTTDLPNEIMAKVKEDKNLDVVVRPSVYERWLAMNLHRKPFDNIKVRRALNYAINKDALIKVLMKGNAKPCTGVIPQGIENAVVMNAKGWPYDPKKAKQLLAEAGYPNGFKTTLWSIYSNDSSRRLLQFLQQQFAQVGVKTDVRALEPGQRNALVERATEAECQTNIVFQGWSSSTGEADWALRPLLYSGNISPNGSGNNVARYSNKEFDDLLDGALATTDKAKKSAMYKRAQEKIWNEDVPWIFLYSDYMVYAKNKKLSGIWVMYDGSLYFKGISLAD